MPKEIQSDQNFHGSQIASLEEGTIPDTPIETIDEYLKVLKANQHRWAQSYPIAERITLLEHTLANIAKYRDEWVSADLLARHIPKGHWDEGNSSLAGPGFAGRMVKVYIETLRGLEKHGGNEPFAHARQDDDRVVIDSYPRNVQEKLLLPRIRAEIHLRAGTKVEDLASFQAAAYKDKNHEGGVALVLGAGNVSSLTINDVFHKLFEEKEVVIVKANPVLEYLGPLLTKIFEPFIKEGFVRIVSGGSREGIHLANHPLVDSIHITGSDKSFEAIIYGSGEQGRINKELDRPVNLKRVTGELGNVTPIIVVPGEWKESDFDYQADNILSMLSHVNGYACVAARVLFLPKFWDGSPKLLRRLAEKMSRARPPTNYYPGTKETITEALAHYPDASMYGRLDENNQPWILAQHLNSDASEAAFGREFWAAFMSQTLIDGTTQDEYLANAVNFANRKLWGTLSVVIIIDGKSQKEMTSSGSLSKAIDDLLYGTVSINVYPGFSFAMATTPWGAYPGSTYNNIQSGNVFVSNPFMLTNVEKSVIYGPFKMFPRPFWFVSDHPKIKVAKALADFAISGKIRDFARTLVGFLR